MQEFFEGATKGFELVADGLDAVSCRAVRGSWFGQNNGEDYLYFIVRLSEEERSALKSGERYELRSLTPEGSRGFAVEAGVGVTVPSSAR